MKKLLNTLLPFCLFCMLTASKCKKDELPPETQEGKNTFGCLVDGVIFSPKGGGIAPNLTCAYQYLNSQSSSGYFFQLSASASGSGRELRSISIATDSLEVREGNVYPLIKSKKGTASAQYLFFPNRGILKEYNTTDTITGELFIKKMDMTRKIVSGTFWFDLINENGEKIQVREGRFDMNFTL